MRYILLICVAVFGIYGCDNAADMSVITSGANYTKEQYSAMENVDENSYAEVADVFLKTNTINGEGLPYLFVFASNGCVYCDRLKHLIRDDVNLKGFLQTNYAPYYINLSYSKTHNVEFLNTSITTEDLARKYAIRPTPTLVFLSQSGKELFVYPGFMPEEQFRKALEFFKNPELQNMDALKIKQAFQTLIQS